MTITLPVSYTTVEIIYDTLGELQSHTTLSSNEIAGFAGRTQALMNAELSKLYSIPISNEVPALQTIATELTIYNILAQRLFTSKRRSDNPWVDRWRESKDILKLIAKGEIPLVDASNSIIAVDTTGVELTSTSVDYYPTFSELDDRQSDIDPDKLDDLEDERL